MQIDKPSHVFSLKARVRALQDRHKMLDTQIAEEQKRPAPNPMRLRLLKARKLILKDEMCYYDGVLRTLQSDDNHQSSSRVA